MESRRVLVVEDEPIINDAVAARLRAEGFVVEQAYDGPSAVAMCADVAPEVVVLDVMLPGFDGYEVCRRIQATTPVPVLMLTARDDEADVLVGLAVGADDYLTKPFRMRELVARVQALLRRVDRAAELATRPSARLVAGDLEVDTGTRRVTVAGEDVRLTPTEFDLLARLAAVAGEVLTREKLLADVWDWPAASGTRTVDSHVKALRAKIGADRVRTVHGVGYALELGGVSSPLAPVTSIKVKLGLLVAASVVVAALVGVVAGGSGVPVLLAVPVTVALALGVTQLLAVGMTSPLREMTEATRQMARGDYRGRVHAESSDEIGELARAFNQMAAELATVDREQRDLVATVSHELRTPMTGLTAVLENLADGVLPADQPHLEAAVAQAQRVNSLLNDLLDLSRVDAGVAPLRLAEVSVSALVDEVVADLVPTGRAVRFDVEIPAALRVHADRARLRQLVTNVLDNAVRHSPEGGQVRVRCALTDDRWRLDVVDDGPGVAPGDRERAFERFGTLSSGPGTQATGGTGLGLAIARWVATLHGGTARFVDPPAGTTGAVLRIDLPRHPSTDRPTHEETTVTTPFGPPGPAPMPPAPAPPIYPGHPGSAVTPAPVLDPLFGRFWPDVAGGNRALVLAASGVGLLAGLVLPNNSAGLALFIVVISAGLTVAYAARHKRNPFTLACLALATLCTLPIVLLDAQWIGVLCVLAGATALIAGVTRVHRVPEFVLAGLAWPLAGLRGLPWLGRSLRRLTGRERAPRVLLTVVWSVLAVLVFGLLFVTADAVVESWLDAALPDVSVDSVVLRVFIAIAVAGPTLAAAYLAVNPPRTEDYGVLPRTAVSHRFEWLVPVLLVDATFVVFVAAQLSVLFGGHDYVQRTTGLTYAEYVHQGFGQLTVATALTLLVVWAASHWAGDTRADRVWLRMSLGTLCALTLVVVGSALYRMNLYQEAYGFTELRLLVDVFEGWLGLVVIAVALAGLVRWGVWLPRFALVSGVIALLGVAAINPDAWIAERNLDRYADTGKVDWYYLQGLSADAVPVFEGRSETAVSCGLPRYWSHDDDWLSWNLGRSRAESVVADHPDTMEVLRSDCPG